VLKKAYSLNHHAKLLEFKIGKVFIIKFVIMFSLHLFVVVHFWIFFTL